MTTRHSIFDERSKNCSSNLPLRSPSPDLKHMSIITPTLLPDSVEIKQFCTTPANKTKYLSSEKLYEEL